VASLDLSSAFDFINIELLLKRLRIIGLPNHVINLINVWFKQRSYYASIIGVILVLFDLLLGTVQGPSWVQCLLNRIDMAPVVIRLGYAEIASKASMYLLGVIFDSSFNWSEQISFAVMKAIKSLNAIKYFTTPELLQLVTSNFYSVLYNNSEIWNSPYLSYHSKQLLMSASGHALRFCLHYQVPNVPFVDLHKITKRTSHQSVGLYKIAIQLFKTYNLLLP
jgi:hypothetical protein